MHRAWGFVERTEIAKPAAGKALTWVAPAAYMWGVVSMFATLTTSAQVANRLPNVQLQDPRGIVYYEAGVNILLPASQKSGLSVTMSPALVSTEKPLVQVLALPAFLLPPEWQIVIGANALQTEDQFSAANVLVEAYEPQPEHPIAEIEHAIEAIRMLGEAVQIAST